MRERYEDRNFYSRQRELIAQANEILEEYAPDPMTIRQLYYQLIARGIGENSEKAYKNFVILMTNARLAGEVDWDRIEDRTREIWRPPETWTDIPDILRTARVLYRVNPWDDQECRVQVWVEKEALAGILQPVCEELQVPFFAAKGFPSLSAVRREAQAFGEKMVKTIILYLADHDPSGIKMAEAAQDRLDQLSGGADVEVRRIALTMDQIEEFDPPPFPVKKSDTRAAEYIEQFGEDAWELDALDPETLRGLVRGAVDEWRDMDLWEAAEWRQQQGRNRILRLVGDIEESE